MTNHVITILSCACGRVRCQAVGKPILSAVCYCDDCQEGGRQIEALHDAARVRDADGGTHYAVYRDDRFSCSMGADLLVGHNLRPRAPTRRFVASCCNTGMYLKFGPGHWISAYAARIDDEPPPVEMRNQTQFRKAQTEILRDAPSYKRFPLRLFAKLIGARIDMALGR